MEKVSVISDTGTSIQPPSHFEGNSEHFRHLETISQMASAGTAALGGRQTHRE